MVIILDGSSEISSHVRGNICYLICLSKLIRSRAVTNRIFISPKTPLFRQTCATCYHLIKVPWFNYTANSILSPFQSNFNISHMKLLQNLSTNLWTIFKSEVLLLHNSSKNRIFPYSKLLFWCCEKIIYKSNTLLKLIKDNT